MSIEKSKDAAEPSPASAGSVDGDPRKYPASTPQVSLVPAEMYHALVVAHEEIARLRLTDAEREAITVAAGDSSQWGRPHARVLLRLLERTK